MFSRRLSLVVGLLILGSLALVPSAWAGDCSTLDYEALIVQDVLFGPIAGPVEIRIGADEFNGTRTDIFVAFLGVRGDGSFLLGIESTYDLGNGDTIKVATEAVQSTTDDELEFAIREKSTITGGTGRFEEAVGRIGSTGVLTIPLVQPPFLELEFRGSGNICTMD